MGVLRMLSLGVLLALPAPADTVDLEKFLFRIRSGEGESVAKDLEGGPVREALRAEPAALDRVCRAADASSRTLARKAPADAPRIAAALLALTAGGPQQAPFAARRARFHALLADARIRGDLGLPVAADPFVDAGEGLEKLAGEDSDSGGCLIDAARAFADGADRPGEKGPGLWDRAEQIVATVRAKHPRDLESLCGGAALLLDRVRWGAERREKGLEPRFDYALDFIAEARRVDPRHRGLGTAFNDAVSLSRTLGIRRAGLEYEADRIAPCTGLQATVPLGSRWTTTGGAVPQVEQVDPVLGRVRAIEFTAYEWELNYDLPDGATVRGDGMKDLAGKIMDGALKRLRKVLSRHPLAAGRLRQCPAGWAFDLSGTDEKGAFLRRREWYFKSTMNRRVTYRIAVLEFQADLAEDPAFQSVLDSLRETPK